MGRNIPLFAANDCKHDFTFPRRDAPEVWR